jgi:glyoxylase-like metal-dependent hydrolase (beta-lactamase superfamily II)
MAMREATLAEVADGCLAYLQGDGGWGWSNAGLIVGDGTSLLVDTLFDLRLTRRMLNRFADHTQSAPIATVVNTHANGDHCYGNSLVQGAQIVSSTATAREMPLVPPSLLATLTAAPGEVGELFRQFFGEFAFDGIELQLPDRTFDGSLELDVGGRTVQLREVGPAHTAGDTLVIVPDAGVVYTGDILFIGGTPIAWAGPIANWIAACDTMIALDAPTVVPGHGPVTDPDGIRAVRGYLAHVAEQAELAHRKGMSWAEAADTVDLGEYATWLDAERVVVNVYQRYRELDPDLPQQEVMALLVMQAEWLAKRSL